LRRKGKLHKDSVHIVARVKFLDQSEYFFGRYRGGRSVQPAPEPQLLARRDLASHVNLRGCIFTNHDCGQTGANSGRNESSNFLFQFGVDLIPNRIAVEDAGRHVRSWRRD